MIHDFEALGRTTPTHLIEQMADVRPPALVAEENNSKCRIFTMRKRSVAYSLPTAEKLDFRSNSEEKHWAHEEPRVSPAKIFAKRRSL
jgi:hypothetical protein